MLLLPSTLTITTSIISVPRDSYVRIYETQNKDGSPKYAKINSAFSSGGGAKKDGYKYAMETVSYVWAA